MQMLLGKSEERSSLTIHCCIVQAFPEADIQSLKEAVQLSRQEAVEALRHTMGDVQRAFTNELAAMHLNVPHLDDLVLAFAAQRYSAWIYRYLNAIQ